MMNVAPNAGCLTEWRFLFKSHSEKTGKGKKKKILCLVSKKLGLRSVEHDQVQLKFSFILCPIEQLFEIVYERFSLFFYWTYLFVPAVGYTFTGNFQHISKNVYSFSLDAFDVFQHTLEEFDVKLWTAYVCISYRYDCDSFV